MRNYRYGVLGFICLLGTILYLDRVAISVAGPHIQEELSLSPEMWGWVVGIFTISYALFEVPTGRMGDRTGPRRVLTRVVLWWSAFTAFTGLASNYYVLLVTRFLFGAGEAGAFPNAGITISRWFPSGQRARALGCFLMSTQIGGATAPLILVPMQIYFGWRVAFFFLGIIGVVWAGAWFWWFRDSPAEKAGVSQREIDEIAVATQAEKHKLPWSVVLRRVNLWAAFLVVACYGFCLYFFVSWLHTYMVKGRGFTEETLIFSAGPPILGAIGNFSGGFISDALCRKYGLKAGRRTVGVIGMGGAAVFMAAAIITSDKYLSLFFLALVYAGITLQQSSFVAVLLDIGKSYVGGVVGVVNMVASGAAFVFSVSFGYFVTWFGNYDLALIPLVMLLSLGAVAWLRLDASEELIRDAIVLIAVPEPATA